MKLINEQTTLHELALIVGSVLKKNKINAVLVGGAVVSIYSENRYQSYDLDFISSGDDSFIEKALLEIGFLKKGRYFKHPNTDFFVEFPPAPVAIGNHPVTKFNIIENEDGFLKLLTPTHSVMDRLSAFYFWNDWQSLEQAVLVAKSQDINFSEIKRWSKEESELEKYKIFLEKLN